MGNRIQQVHGVPRRSTWGTVMTPVRARLPCSPRTRSFPLPRKNVSMLAHAPRSPPPAAITESAAVLSRVRDSRTLEDLRHHRDVFHTLAPCICHGKRGTFPG